MESESEQLSPSKQLELELFVRMEALGELCGPPETKSPEQVKKTNELREKYRGAISKE